MQRKTTARATVIALGFMVVMAGWLPAAGQPEDSDQPLIGYNNLFLEEDFFIIVRNGLAAEAERAGFAFQEAISQRDATLMRQNVETFVVRGADLIIDFNVLPEAGSAIAADLQDDGIPLISIDAPYDDAYFFGVNNIEAGRALGAYAVEAAGEKFGTIDWVVNAYVELAGPEVRKRNEGVVEEAVAAFDVPESRVVWLDTQADDVRTRTLITDWLNAHPDASNILFVGQNDDRGFAINAVVENLGREDDVLIVSHNADPAAIENLTASRANAWVATASYNSHTYGAQIIDMASRILAGEDVPQSVYTTVTIVNRDNVAEYVEERDATLEANASN